MSAEYRISILCEDQEILREGLRSLLSLFPEFNVTGDLEGDADVIEQIEILKPDLVLTNLSLLLSSKLEVIRRIKSRFPTVKILAMINHKDGECRLEVREAGAEGCLPMDATPRQLVEAIKSVLQGQFEEIVETQKTMQPLLTRRERDVLVLIAKGQRNREIAEYLGISINTVGAHRTNLMRKLNLHNVQALTRFAIEKGLAAR